MNYVNFFILLLILVGQITHNRKVNILMANQQEAAAQLVAANATLVKIGAETSTLLEKVTALEAAAANADQVSPELQAAIDGVVSQASTVDNLVPDATP